MPVPGGTSCMQRYAGGIPAVPPAVGAARLPPNTGTYLPTYPTLPVSVFACTVSFRPCALWPRPPALHNHPVTCLQAQAS